MRAMSTAKQRSWLQSGRRYVQLPQDSYFKSTLKVLEKWERCEQQVFCAIALLIKP